MAGAALEASIRCMSAGCTESFWSWDSRRTNRRHDISLQPTKGFAPFGCLPWAGTPGFSPRCRCGNPQISLEGSGAGPDRTRKSYNLLEDVLRQLTENSRSPSWHLCLSHLNTLLWGRVGRALMHARGTHCSGTMAGNLKKAATSGLLWDSERPSILVNCRVPMSIS